MAFGPKDSVAKVDARLVMVPDTGKTLNMADELLEEVVISGTSTSRNLDVLPGSISVIQTLKPAKYQSTSISTILEQVPGVQMQSGTSNTTRITLRGIGSRSPYATNRIRAFLNEIPLTGGDGGTVVEDLEIWETGGIEIIRGPSSALYGSGLGGTLVFRPLAGQAAKWSSFAVSEAGSFGFYKAGAHLGYRDSLTTLQGGIYRTLTNGYRQNNRYNRTNGIFRFTRVINRHQLSLLVNYVDLFAQIPSSVNYDTYAKKPHLAAPNWLAIKGYEQYSKWQGGFTLISQLRRDVKNHFSLYTIYNKAYESRPFNILETASLTTGMRNRLVWSAEKIVSSIGFEAFREQYGWDIYETVGGQQGAQQTKNQDLRHFLNLFLHAEWNPWPQTRLAAGANLHNASFRSTSTRMGEPGEPLNRQYPHQLVLSPRLGISQRIAPTTWLFVSAGHGFSVPSSEEAMLPDGTINQDLKPEEGINLDAGIRSSLWGNRARLEVTGYHIWVSNLLITKRTPKELFYSENAGKTVHQGIESRFELDLINPLGNPPGNLKIDVAHTLMNNYFQKFSQESQNLKGHKLPGLAAGTLSARLVYHHRMGLDLQLRFTGVTGQYLNDLNTAKVPGHELVDLSGAFTQIKGPLKGLILKAGIQNIFDTRYAAMVVVNAPSFGNALPRYYYPGLPRNFFMGISYKFDSD
jgi:iron complex outermembrane recepter protein